MFGNLSYTNKDIISIREEIIDFIKEHNPDWADFNESSIQMQYTEMLAGVADMLCYYLDSQALETFLTSARQKKNINSILKMINYNFDVIGCSMGSAVFTRTPHEQDDEGKPIYMHERYYIPKYLDLWTDENDIHFLTSEETSMPEDSMIISVPIIQGTLVEKNFPIETVKQSFQLQVASKAVPIDHVFIENEGYTKVEDAFVLLDGGPYYSVHYDSYNNVYILFTYNYKQFLPETGDLVVSYVDTLGKEGNVESGQIVHYGKGILGIDDENSDIVELSVNNPSATYGGFSDIDYKKHQANAKNWLLCHDTIVLMSDFETMVKKESWVLDCACFDWRKDDTIVDRPYILKAWVVAVEGPELDDKELKSLTHKLQQKTVIMNTVEILNAEFVSFDLQVILDIDGTNISNKEKIRIDVEEQLKKWYFWNYYIKGEGETRLAFGLKMDVTKLSYDIASMASAISKVQILTDDFTLKKTEFLYCTSVKVRISSEDGN